MKSKERCAVCGGEFSSHSNGIAYCNKHYLQMHQNGFIGAKSRKNTNTFTFNGDTAIGTTSNGRQYKFNKDDYDKVSKYSWCFSKTGYLVANIDGKVTKLHRYILDASEGETIDHINGDPADNRRKNLRFCTSKENSRNTSGKGAKSGHTGVKKTPSGKYLARIMVDRKEIRIGLYERIEDAVTARLQAEKQYFGEFAPSLSRAI